MENTVWTPPAGELIKSACPMGNCIVIFTDKGVYQMEWPPKLPWYKRVWRKIWK